MSHVRIDLTASGIGPLAALLALSVSMSAVAAPVTASESHSVTLITGDRVIVSSINDRMLSMQPASGREHMSFSTEYQRSDATGREHLYVMPSDAAALVASGKLDRELFNVTMLVQSGYGDEDRDDVPLIVTYDEKAPPRPPARTLASAGAAIGDSLSSINAVTVRAKKENLPSFWGSVAALDGRSRSVAASRGALGPSVKKVWLDRKLQPLLDRSVSQIGAPAVWASGYTGKSIVVAVIDTGVDTTHPDLAGKVVESRNFTDEVDDDTVGHGTHVAATIAGSGAASGGRYRGVAPDAELISAKVCAMGGCPMSATIQAMEWAVSERSARIVNMSLGGFDTTEIDPQEEAVNRLTAQYGALFVVAAGNCLFESACGAPYTVSSPASASAALAVGAVDRADVVARFSNRGPRVSDHAVKPEIAAPGVGIVAARARNTEVGQPVGDFHIALSGTSMAAPHVAGAAALLLERHPQWTGSELKSVLVGSAKFIPGAGIFDQGAGRLDAKASLDAAVLADSSTLDLGIAQWPHHDDAPVVRRITYRNLGNGEVSLALRLEVAGPQSKPLPAGMLEVKPATLTIAPGASAVATLTAHTRIEAKDGLYSGRLIAASSAGTIATPLSLYREEESYDIELRHLDASGAPAVGYLTRLVSLDRELPWLPTVDNRRANVSVRVPRGRYGIAAGFFTLEPFQLRQLIWPSYTVAAPASLTLDARLARPVTLRGPSDTINAFVHMGWTYDASWGRVEGASFGDGAPGVTNYVAHVGDPSRGFKAFISSQWIAPGEDAAATSKFYAASWERRGVFFDGLERTIRPERMARVEATYLPSPGITAATMNVAADHGQLLRIGGVERPVSLPHRRAEFYSTADQGNWLNQMGRWTASGPTGYLLSDVTRYKKTAQYRSTWNQPPYGPAFPTDDDHPDYRGPHRVGDQLRLNIPLFGDEARHIGEVVTQARRLTLYRDGTKVFDVTGPSAAQVTVPPESASYRLEASAGQSTLGLSTAVGAIWTFESEHAKGEDAVLLPLLTIQFQPSLADAKALHGSKIAVPITVWRNGHSKPIRPSALTVEVSFDDGATWTRAPVKIGGEHAVVLIRHPRKAGYVSLRGYARERDGNSVEVTMLRAYPLPGK